MRCSWLVVSVVLIPTALHADEGRDRPILALDAGGHTAPVKDLVFTPGGKELISYGRDKTVRVWDIKTGETVRVLRLPVTPEDRTGPGGSQGAALSADGKLLAVAARAPVGGQHWVYLIDLAANKVVRVFGKQTHAIHAVALSRDGRWLASCGVGGLVLLWDLSTGQTRATLKGHAGGINAVAFSPDSQRLATAGDDRTVRLWSVAAAKEDARARGQAEEILSLAWSPDGRTLAGCGRESVVYLWNPDGTPRPKIPRNGKGLGVTFSSDSRLLLVGGCLIDLEAGKERLGLGLFRHTGHADSSALSPDGRWAVWGGLHGEELLLWDATAGRTRDVQVRRLGGKGHSITDVAWSPDGRTVAWEYVDTEAAQGERRGWGRSFDFSRLQLRAAPGKDFQHAQHRAGGLTVDSPTERQLVIRRGKEVLSTVKLPGGKGGVNAWTFLGEGHLALAKPTGLFLFDTHTGQRTRTFKGAGTQHALAPEPGHRYLAAGGLDQILRVYTPDREEPLVSLFVAGDNWIAWTPEGYYAASPGGERLMGWQVHNGPAELATFHPANRFRGSLHRPDVIREILAAGSVGKALAQADRRKGKKSTPVVVDEVRPPRVWIISPEKNLASNQAQLQVKAAAESTGKHAVTSLLLLLDGRPFEGQRGVPGADAARPGKVEKDWTVTLTPGTHRLTVLAKSDVSTAMSQPVEVTYTPPHPVETRDTRPNLYVLAIGINAYPGDLQLDCAVNDATGVSKTLQTRSEPLFHVKCKILPDREATRDGILQGLGWLKGQMKPHDVALLFYAGHGYNDEAGRFYMLSIDMDVDNLDKTTVTGEELKKHLAELPGRVVLMLDACHSGAKGNTSLIGSGKSSSTITDDLVRDLVDDDCGVIVMCAAMGREESRESAELKHGYFTLALMEGLSGKADYDKDGVILLTELDLYVDNRVRELSKDEQHPVTAKPTTIRSFALAKP